MVNGKSSSLTKARERLCITRAVVLVFFIILILILVLLITVITVCWPDISFIRKRKGENEGRSGRADEDAGMREEMKDTRKGRRVIGEREKRSRVMSRLHHTDKTIIILL